MSHERECPFCAETIKRKAKVCRFCKSAVTPIYVDHSGANTQIAKILDLIEQGKSYESVANQLNDSKEFRLDNDEPWTSEEIEKIDNDFGPQNSKSTASGPVEVTTNDKPANKEPWNKEEVRKFNTKFFVGGFLVLVGLSTIFNNKESTGKSNSNYLAKDRAIEVCYNAWDREIFGDNFSYYKPVDFKNRWALDIDENKYRVVVEFSKQGAIKRFACDVFLENGKVKYRVENNGGLYL